jgi:hypothetical protein
MEPDHEEDGMSVTAEKTVREVALGQKCQKCHTAGFIVRLSYTAEANIRRIYDLILPTLGDIARLLITRISLYPLIARFVLPMHPRVAAQEAADTAERTLKLFARDKDKIQELGRATPSALRLHEFIQTSPYVRIRTAAKALKLTVPTVTSSLNHLVRLGIVKEVSGKHRDRLFAYSRYVNMVSEGTNPLSTA